MVEEYVRMDRRHDDFYLRFMGQMFQKLNNSEHFVMEDSLPLPIEPLLTVPTAVPQKQISNTSSDSGLDSPNVLSKAMPVTPDYSQPYLMPSTSKKNPPSGPLTPFQQFIHNSQITKTKEPKFNRSQPEHPDPQSVLRTRTGLG